MDHQRDFNHGRVAMESVSRRASNNSSNSGASSTSTSEGSIEANLRLQQQLRLGIEEPSALSCFFSALARRKPLDTRTETNLNRCLNLTDLTALGVGTTLGLGLYVLTGEVASTKAGPAVVISFALAALASAFSALCYAEFAGRVPRAGSAYAYSYITVGEFIAFIIGWNLILEYVIGTASVARGFSSYLRFLYRHVVDLMTASAPAPPPTTTTLLQAGAANATTSWCPPAPESTVVLVPWTEAVASYVYQYFDWLSVAIIVVTTIFILLGVKGSTNVTMALTALNLLVVGAMVVSSLEALDLHNWRLSKSEVPQGFGEGGFLPYGWSGVLAGGATCFFGFIGFDTIASSAEEAKNPKRTVPLSILLSLFISFVAYMAVAAVQTLLWPYYEQNGETILPYIFGRLGMPITYWIILVGAIAGLASSQLGGMYPLPRVLYSMADDRLIYGYLARVNRRLKLPVRATIVGSVLVAALSCLLNIKDLADMVSIGTLAAYSLVSLSVLILRYENRDDIMDNAHIGNNHLTFSDIISTMDQTSADSFTSFAVKKKISESRVKLSSRVSICAAAAEDGSQSTHKKLAPKPSTPIREKGSRPLTAQLSVGFQSWFRAESGGCEPAESQQQASDNNTGKRQSFLDLLISWRTDDQANNRQPDSESSRKSKILISIIVVLTIVLDIVVLLLTNDGPAKDPCPAPAANRTLPGDSSLTVDRGPFTIRPQLLLGSIGCIVGVVLAAVLLMLARLPTSRSSRSSDMFQVPLVPLVPTLSILVNTFLMMNLSYLTWVRFIVWMAVGFFIYFSYGLWNSKGFVIHPEG